MGELGVAGTNNRRGEPSRQKSRFLALAALPIVALAAPSNTSQSTGALRGTSQTADETTEITIVYNSELGGRGPFQGANTETNSFFQNIYDPLVRLGSNQEFIGVLAESWENPDPLTWRFHLYEEATFADGSPVTADDVAFTYDRIKTDPESLVAGHLEHLIDIVVIDDHTIDLVTDEPVATFLINLDTRVVQKRAYVEEVGFEEADANPIGSGPYELVEWLPGERYVVELRDDFWGADVNPTAFPAIASGTAPDRVVYRFVGEPEVQVTGLLNGEFDITAPLPANLVPRVAESDVAHIAETQDAAHYFYMMNPITEAMSKLEVRQAIYHAIDVEGLVAGPLQGAATALHGPLLPDTYGYVDDLQTYPYDPERSRELLAEAGYPDGITIDFPCPDGFYHGEKEVCDATSAMLAEAGIDAPVRMVEYTTYNEENRDNQYEFFIARNTMSAGDPGLYDSWFLCINDRTSFCDEEFTELYVEQLGIVDTDERADVIADAWHVLMANPPVVFLFRLDVAVGVSDRVIFSPDPGGSITPADIEVTGS